MNAVVAAFNYEKALVGAFSVIAQLHRLIVYRTWVRRARSVPAEAAPEEDTGELTDCHPKYIGHELDPLIARQVTNQNAFLNKAKAQLDN